MRFVAILSFVDHLRPSIVRAFKPANLKISFNSLNKFGLPVDIVSQIDWRLGHEYDHVNIFKLIENYHTFFELYRLQMAQKLDHKALIFLILPVKIGMLQASLRVNERKKLFETLQKIVEKVSRV